MPRSDRGFFQASMEPDQISERKRARLADCKLSSCARRLRLQLWSRILLAEYSFLVGQNLLLVGNNGVQFFLI
jgi:hypothetical protein